MEEVVCNLCGSNKSKHVYSMPENRYFLDRWFNVVECKQCGLGYVNPRPNFSEMSEYYPEKYYEFFRDDPKYHKQRMSRQAEFVNSVTKDKKTLLDIGCANGEFPKYMKHLGWEVEGVEVSANTFPNSDFVIYNMAFTDIPINEPKYDVITAWAVLEHVHDPAAYFQKVSQVLNKDGIFIFLVTNFDSISSRFLFREDIPRHLYFFTPKNILQYLENNRLRLISSHYNNRILSMAPLNWLRYYLLFKLRKKEFRYKDIPILRAKFLENDYNYKVIANLKYVINYPFATVDRLLMPIFEQYQIWNNTYGIVTYVAKKEN